MLRSLCALLALAALARADDTDRDRRAKAALALAGLKPLPAKAPAPRAATQGYAAGYRAAALDAMPLVVFVGCDTHHPVSGAVVAKADEFGDVRGPAVVVGYPVQDRLFVHETLQCPVTDAQLARAVKDAAKKISQPERKDMPLARPLKWDI